MKKIVMVTGATSGFGRATALLFVRNGFRVIVTGRRTDRLTELVRALSAGGGEALALPFDVRDRAAVEAAIAGLPPDWRAIDVLVNNAGLALGRDFFDEASMDDWETMIDTNVKGLLYVTRAVLPLMIPRRSGHIINLGSIAGKQVYEKGNVYCATKFAVGALSQSMREDLLRHRIKVTLVEPGAADTEFSLVRFKQDGEQAAKVYQGYEALTAEDVARVIFFAAGLPDHVCINQLEITPRAQANSYYTFRESS